MKVFDVVKNTIKEHNLIVPGDRVLLGLSGGADSVALFHILKRLSKELGFCVACAHINHSLRETANRDMLFCKQLCKDYGVEFFCKTVNIKAEAKTAGMSEEAYARNVRYDFFGSLGFDKIATAHNKNDVAETLLLNFMRGAALSGLGGIPYVRNNIVRPLLDVKKSDVVTFCRENGYEYVTDETNFEELYTRNKIRLDLIPKIEEKFNPNFVNVAAGNAKLLREDSEFLDSIAKKEYKGYIDIAELLEKEMPVCRRLIQIHWKSAAECTDNLSLVYLEDIIALCKKGSTGKSVDLPGGFYARCQYGRLIIEKHREEISFEYEIYPGMVLNIPKIGKNVLIKESESPDFYLDPDSLLVIRSRRAGDIFYPTGMTGKKKLSDFFTDKKIPKNKRDMVPVLTAGGEIVAVGNMRYDRRFSDKRKTGYKMEIKENVNAQ